MLGSVAQIVSCNYPTLLLNTHNATDNEQINSYVLRKRYLPARWWVGFGLWAIVCRPLV